MFDETHRIQGFDEELFEALEGERRRQEEHIELIGSENFASPRVLEAQGSVLTNKYAEGYPGRRYYGGCEYVDVAERLAIERAKALFGADFANVQPHSGSQANMAAYLAMMEPGDTLLGMSLPDGGHLTHGAKVSFSGKFFRSVQYGVDRRSGEIDYESVAELAREHRPKVIVAGFSAYSRVVDWQRFRDIADEAGAWLLVDMAHVAGLVAAGVYPNPTSIADITTTTTHKTLRGPRGGLILARHNPELIKRINFHVFPCTQGGPLMQVIAAKAVALAEASRPEFRAYQIRVLANARCMARTLMERGYKIVSGGTDNHLMLVDLVKQGITGQAAEEALSQANITVNRNAVPNDPRPPRITSGLRIGTPAITTRGFMEAEAGQLGHWIADILDTVHDDANREAVAQRVRAGVRELSSRFPVYSPASPAAA